MHQQKSVESYDSTLFFYAKKRLHAFCTPFAHLPGSGLFCARLAQPAFLCIKRELVGARFLHLLSQIVLSLKHPTGAFVASQMPIFSADKALVNSLHSSASISRMASRISLPMIFVAAGVSFCWGFHKRLRQKRKAVGGSVRRRMTGVVFKRPNPCHES